MRVARTAITVRKAPPVALSKRMSQSDPARLDKIERLQNLPYDQQLQWAAQLENP